MLARRARRHCSSCAINLGMTPEMALVAAALMASVWSAQIPSPPPDQYDNITFVDDGRRIGAVCSQPLKYVIVATETCDYFGYETITEFTECTKETAETALNSTITGFRFQNEYSSFPAGCSLDYQFSRLDVQFNSRKTSTATCDRYNPGCICRVPKPLIVAGFSLQWPMLNGPYNTPLDTCYKQNSAACKLGLRDCQLPAPGEVGCNFGSGTHAADSRKLQFIHCEPPVQAAETLAGRTQVTAQGTTTSATASCPFGSSINFGFKVHFSSKIVSAAEDLCVKANTGLCRPGDTDCSTTACDTAGTDFMFIFLVCDQLAEDFGVARLSPGFPLAENVLECPEGGVVDFGFSFAFSDSSKESPCFYDSERAVICPKGSRSCSPPACSLATPYPHQLGLLSCAVPSCAGKIPLVANAVATLSSAPLADNSYRLGTTATYACLEGTEISHTNGATCINGTWDLGVVEEDQLGRLRFGGGYGWGDGTQGFCNEGNPLWGAAGGSVWEYGGGFGGCYSQAPFLSTCLDTGTCANAHVGDNLFFNLPAPPPQPSTKPGGIFIVDVLLAFNGQDDADPTVVWGAGGQRPDRLVLTLWRTSSTCTSDPVECGENNLVYIEHRVLSVNTSLLGEEQRVPVEPYIGAPELLAGQDWRFSLHSETAGVPLNLKSSPLATSDTPFLTRLGIPAVAPPRPSESWGSDYSPRPIAIPARLALSLGIATSAPECRDIDECAAGPRCDVLSHCVNLFGGFNCSACPPGYQDGSSPDAPANSVCMDVDECATQNNGDVCKDFSPVSSVCINTNRPLGLGGSAGKGGWGCSPFFRNSTMQEEFAMGSSVLPGGHPNNPTDLPLLQLGDQSNWQNSQARVKAALLFSPPLPNFNWLLVEAILGNGPDAGARYPCAQGGELVGGVAEGTVDVVCEVAHGMGRGLRLRLSWGVNVTLGGDKGTKEVVGAVMADHAFSFPDVRLPGGIDTTPAAPLQGLETVVFFQALNLVRAGSQPQQLRVFFGTDTKPNKYQCSVTGLPPVATPASDLTCTLGPEAEGTGKFTVYVHYSEDPLQRFPGAYSVTNPNPVTVSVQAQGAPFVEAVGGCQQPDTDGNTVECPVTGLLLLTVTGENFAPPVSVLVGGSPCPNSGGGNASDTSTVVCVLPRGVGSLKQVSITAGNPPRVSSPLTAKTVSYSAPKVTRITGCAPTEGDALGPLAVQGCSRETGSVITIFGTNLGTDKIVPSVLVGSQQCANLTFFEASQALSCVVPPDNKENVNVFVLQQNGALSRETVTISYEKCPKGTVRDDTTSASACLSCPPGKANNQEGSVACVSCQLGRFAGTSGSIACQACSKGRFRDAALQDALLLGEREGMSEPELALLAECGACPQGSFAQELGQVKCTECRAGEFGVQEGMEQCVPCGEGTFAAAPGLKACQACAPGRAAAARGQTRCQPCPAGTVDVSFNNVSRASCEPCLAGSFEVDNTQCLACAVGSYQDSPGQQSCKYCERGKFGSQASATACANCRPGTARASQGGTACDQCTAGRAAPLQGLPSCQPCGPGFSSPSNSSLCFPCMAGFFSMDEEAAQCQRCPAGSYSGPAAAQCEECLPGTFAQVQATGCQPCQAGFFAEDARSSGCLVCPQGTFSGTAASVCQPCEEGAYAADTGAAFCSLCPLGTTANAARSLCACPDNTYLSDSQCLPCPEGARCSGKGNTKADLETLPGYWRPGGAGGGNGTAEEEGGALVWHRCARASHCLGGVGGGRCAVNRGGPVCAVCLPGFQSGGPSRDCTECLVGGGSWGLALLLVLLSLLGVTGIFYILLRGDTIRIMQSGEYSRSSHQVRRALQKVTRMVRQSNAGSYGSPGSLASRKASYSSSVSAVTEQHQQQGSPDSSASLDSSTQLDSASALTGENVSTLALQNHPAAAYVNLTFPLKVLISFFQILTNLSALNAIQWPSHFRSFISAFAFVNFDFLPWQSLACSVGTFTFYTKLMLTTLTPLGLLLLLALFFLVPLFLLNRRDLSDSDLQRTRRMLRKAQFYKLVAFMLFLMYPVVSSSVLAVFECYEIDGVHYLVSDFNLTCYEGDWKTYSSYAIGMVFLYPLGIPLALTIALYRKRRVLYDDALVRVALGFAYEAYSRGMWWIEIVDMLHKLALTSLLRFLAPLAGLQLGLILSGGYLILILVMSPYVRRSDDRLHLLVQCELLSLILAAYLSQSLYKGGMPADVDVVLSVFLIVLFVLGFLVSLLQFCVFVRKFRNALVRQGKTSGGGGGGFLSSFHSRHKKSASSFFSLNDSDGLEVGDNGLTSNKGTRNARTESLGTELAIVGDVEPDIAQSIGLSVADVAETNEAESD